MGNKDKCKTKGCGNKCEKRKKFCVKCHAANQTTTTTVKCWNCDNDHPGVGLFCPYCGEPNSGQVKEEATPSTESLVTSKLKRRHKEDVDTLTQLLPKRKLECSASGDTSLSQDSNRPVQGQPVTISDTSTNERHKIKPSEGDHNKVDASTNSVKATTSTVMPNSLSQDSKRPTQGQPGTVAETSTNERQKNEPSEEDHNKLDASSDSVEATANTMVTNSLSQDSSRHTNDRHKNKPSDEDHNNTDASSNLIEGNSTMLPNESHKPSMDSSGKHSSSVSTDGQLTTDRKDEMHSTPVVVRNTTVVIQAEELVPSGPLDGNTINTNKSALDCTSKDEVIRYKDVKFEENYATKFSKVSQVFGDTGRKSESVGYTLGVNQSSTPERKSCVHDPESKQAARDTSLSSDSKSTTEEHTGTTSENSTKADHDTLKQQVTKDNLQSKQCSSGGKATHVATSEVSKPNQNTRVSQNGNNHHQNPDQLMDTREDDPSVKCEKKAKSENPPSYAEKAGSASQPPFKDENKAKSENPPSYAEKAGSKSQTPFKDGECDNRRGLTVITRGNSKGKKNPDHVGNVRTPSTLTDGKNEVKMTVCFHTVVTPEFNFNPKTDTMVMRFNTIGNFQKDVGKMEVERSESNYAFVKIELTIKPYHFSSKDIKYKYLLKRCIKGQQDPIYIWEFIDKYPCLPGHVNRLLKVPKEAFHKQETFHHYDGALHVEEPVKSENRFIQGTKSFLNKIIRNVWKTDTLDKDMKLRRDHEIAVQSYLPEWEGFVCQHHNQNVTNEGAVKAFKKLCQITEQMSDSWVFDGIAKKWKPGNFSMKEVLQNYFDEKLDEISNNEKDKDESSISQQLISALAIAMVDEKYSFLEYATRHKLLRALVLPSCLMKAGYENLIREIKKEFSGKMMRMVTKAIQTLCNNAMCSTGSSKVDLTFLLVLPILHFLRGDSSPMEWPEHLDRFGYEDDSWWGHETLNVKSLRMQNIDQNHDNFLPVLIEIEPLFKVDHLLQRSFLATVRFNALVDILKQIKFDFPVACFIIGLSIIRQNYLYHFQDKLKLMLSVLVKNAQEENSACAQRCEEKWHKDQSTNVTDVLLNLLPVLVNKAGTNTQLVVHYSQLLSEALRNEEVHCGIESNSVQDRLVSVTLQASEIVIHYLRLHIHDITFSGGRILNGFFNIKFENKNVNDTWVSSLTEFLLTKFEMESPENIIQFYCCIEDPSPYHPAVNRAVTDKAFNAIDQVMMSRHTSSGMFSFLYAGMRSSNRLGHLLSSFINKSLSNQTITLKKCLTWHPLSGFLKMADINFLGTEAKTNIMTAKSVVEDIISRLFNGEITVEELGVIQQHEEDFLKLSEVIDLQQITSLLEKETNRNSIVLAILRCRLEELQAFKDVRHRVGMLITFCSRMQHESANTGTKVLAVDISETTTAHNADVSQMQLLKLCKLIPVEVAIFCPSRVPVITFFKLPDNVSDMLLKMEKIHNSGIFQQFWNKRADVVLNRHSKDSLISLEVVETQIWRFVKGEWDQLKEQLVSGSISLYGVNNKLGKIMDDQLEDNLRVFEEDDTTKNDWIKERCDQVRLYRQLKKCLQSAKIILEIKKQFGLKGNFRSVELLYSTSKEEFNNKCLTDLNEDVGVACWELKNVTEEQIRCLQILINCKDLIIWIKREIENMHELKVFVDLAMIQAGETPIEVYRVSCLHQAATGYSAFIFNLTEWSSYKHLMTICRYTWKALENDPDLSIKLESISREMEWLKGIKDSHGSVEVLSLHQVERINAEGIYEIGKLKEGSLRLRVPAEDGKEMIYTVEQIKDLQSKLMLIAGEAYQCTDAKAEVDRFVEVFDGTQDLEKYYQKMCRSGNVLFTNLEIALHCKISTKTPVYIDFCVTGQESLFGSKEKLTDILKELINFMKASLKQWYDYIDEMREEFYHLNVYTTKQLVILQRALALFGEEGIGPEVYALLSLVKPNCTVQDLRKAVTEVEKEKESELNVDETCETNNDQMGNFFLDEEKEHMAAFWDEMDDMMDEEQAMAVLEEKGLMNVEAAVTYISESPYSKETLDVLVERFITRVGCTLSDLVQNHDEETERKEQIENVLIGEQKYKEQIRLQNRGHGTDSVKKDLLLGMKRFEGTLIDKLKHVWEKYLSSTKSADLTDYVSVETLGRLLEHLATPDCEATVRRLPQLLKRGRPNLIVCSASNVLHTVLSVYMEGNGSFPAYDEVLLCNSQTSLEEVVLLWRRALNGNKAKTYCLVNADALDYDVSVDAVKKLHELMEGKSGYKLVIVCNAEREHQSHVIKALHSGRISSDKPTCRESEEIQDYLHMQFIQQVQQTNQRLQLAVRLPNDRTCVQCISSNRPGVGKSLLIQRYNEELQRDGRHLDCCITVPLQTTTVQEHDVAKTLISQIQEMDNRFSRIVHLDVSPNVCRGLDHLLFNLLILNTICAQDGLVWRRNCYDLYLVEVTKACKARVEDAKVKAKSRKNTFLESLPTVLCRPPKETLIIEDEQSNQEIPSFHDHLMDDLEFRSSRFQRPYQYLAGLDKNADLDAFKYSDMVYGNHVDCLKILLRHCGLPNPSWAELSHFACFLNKQLEDCEGSVFCDPGLLADTGMNGFKTFVVKFMLQMAKDFATPSLQMSDESSLIDVNQEDEENLQAFQLRRRWENSPHPYIFFNHDHVTMTFMGFSIDRNGRLLDVDGQVLQQNMMRKSLMRGLKLQNVNLEEDFDSLPRDQKLQKLCMVMGIENVSNPDETYELTTDNVKKILAIHMRFRCGIPKSC
ncbi:E3 ubiquitin-protein ligase rnf213-alpha-like [Anneissia japonica]|uniref:E3 ubiquitin-protein ligase rnf213-alpha-like n=1 Tax=Anneissia japonica TaxID=1529436 RepID=UPI0014257DEC|nr:E3 ubiquitin-protein ligase rnf213-alpha-like [Anneissia japonica]